MGGPLGNKTGQVFQEPGGGAFPFARDQVFHQLAHGDRDRARLKHAFDRGQDIGVVGVYERALRPQRRLAGDHPVGEVGHPRQVLGPRHGRKAPKATRHRVKQGAENGGMGGVEGRPNVILRLPVLGVDRLAGRKDRALGQVRPLDDFLDAIEDGRARAREHNFVLIGVKLAGAKPGP